MARIHARRRAWHTALGDKRPREQQPPLSERAEPCYRVWRGRSTHLGKRLKTRRAGGLTSSGPRFESIIDRKSTRLNSSHGYISYAVFCLKKKKKTNFSPHIKNT